MGIRDDEFKRVVKYAEGLGLKVIITPYTRGEGGAGYWHMDATTIEARTWPRQSKTYLILSLLHELGHHMHWVYDGKRVPQEVKTAYGDEAARKLSDPFLPQKQRKLIYDYECSGIQYMSILAKEMNLKIKENKILLQMDLDAWMYEQYYLSGHFPTQKEVKIKKRQLKEKYARKNKTS